MAVTSYTHTTPLYITKAQIKLNYWIEQNGFVVSAIDLAHVTVFKLACVPFKKLALQNPLIKLVADEYCFSVFFWQLGLSLLNKV